MLVLKTLLVLAFFLWIIFLWRRRKFYKLMLKVPGPKGLPLLGVLYKFRVLEDLFHFAQNAKKKYGFPLLTWIGPFPTFVLADPITAQDILTSPHCLNKAKLYGPLADVFGNGLLTIANPEWAVHRKLLNPSVNPENLRSFVPIFNGKTKGFLKNFEASYSGESVNVLPLIQRLTMNTALQTTLGLKKGDETNTYNKSEERLFRYYHDLAELIMSFIIMPWLRLGFVNIFFPKLRKYTASKRELQKYFMNIIVEKLAIPTPSDQAKTTSRKPEDSDIDTDLQKNHKFFFIDMAVELVRNGKLTAKDVEDHSNNMVAGAYETTATTITHTLILLAMNPQYQQILFEELFSLYADRDDVTVTDEELSRLVYLEMVINETLRLIPTVPLVGRTATADITLSSGIVLPAGIQIMLDIFDLHRNESMWGPNASVFNPENFLPDNLRDKHPYAFLPFAKGVRICIGSRYAMISVKVMLAIILRKYRVTTNIEAKLENFRYEPAISFRIINPPLLKFHLREK